MSVEIYSIFALTPRRGAVSGQTELLTGRWATIDTNGLAVYPGAGVKTGLYLVLEGTHIHLGDGTAFALTTPYDSTNKEALPAVKASGAVGLAFGSAMRATVGVEGLDPAETYTVGLELEVDAAGRLIPVSAGVAVAKVEAVTTGVGGVTSITFVVL